MSERDDWEKGLITSVRESDFTRSGEAVVVESESGILRNMQTELDRSSCEDFEPEVGMEVKYNIETVIVEDEDEPYDDVYEIEKIDENDVFGRKIESPYLRMMGGKGLEDEVVEAGDCRLFPLCKFPDLPVEPGDTFRTRVDSVIVPAQDETQNGDEV